MATSSCLGHLQACAIRVARLDSTGAPLSGADNLYVSSSLVSFGVTPDVEAGQEFNVKNACDDICVSYKSPDKIKRYTVELEICIPDPVLSEILSEGVVLTDGTAKGYGYPRLNVAQAENGVSIELWTKQVNDEGNQDPDYPWAWWAWPKVILRPAGRTFNNGPLNNLFSGYAIENSAWADGPANDWPVASDRVGQWIETDAIPDAACESTAIAS